MAAPVDGGAQARIELRVRAKSELALGAGHIQAAARLAVRAGRVPCDAPPVLAERGDSLRQVAYGNLFSAAHVHRRRAVVNLRRQHDGLGGILDVEEFPGRRSVTPQSDRVFAAALRPDALPDQR